jgi:hypothetical protein
MGRKVMLEGEAMLLHPGRDPVLQVSHLGIGDSIEHVSDGRVLRKLCLAPGLCQHPIGANRRLNLIDRTIADEHTDQQRFEFVHDGVVVYLEWPVQGGPDGC